MVSEKMVEMIGEHRLYSDPRQAVIHKRGFKVNFENNELQITDTLEGERNHCVSHYFHFFPGTELTVNGKNFQFCRGNLQGEFSCDEQHDLDFKIRQGWWAPSYGVKERIPVVEYRTHKISVPSRRTFRLKFYAKPVVQYNHKRSPSAWR